MKKQIIYLSLGGNLGDRLLHLQNARKEISQRIGTILQESPIYETAAWGLTAQPDFLNQVIKAETSLPPEDLIFECLSIEKDLGRVRKVRWGERIIDIDILFIDQLILNTQRLTVPHPEMHKRRFALQPMTDLDKNFVHPVFKETMMTLLEKCVDTFDVKHSTLNV